MQTETTFKPTIKQILTKAVAILEKVEVDTPLLDAEVMLSELLGVPRSYLFAHPEELLDCVVVGHFESWLRFREQRVPLAYIIGHKEFYGLDLEVTPAVLIPRQETEVLVETAISALRGIASPMVAEVGVGSGAVAIALAKSVPDSMVFGTDSSAQALEVARRNVEKHALAQRIKLRLGNLLEPLAGLTFSVIVSNPPYIPTDEIPNLQPEIFRYEPLVALDGGPDGLEYHRRIAREAPSYLEPGGLLILEVGCGQSDAVKALLASAGFTHIRSMRDLGGVERVVIGKYNAHTCVKN